MPFDDMIVLFLFRDRLDYCATKRTWRNQEMRRWDRVLLQLQVTGV